MYYVIQEIRIGVKYIVYHIAICDDDKRFILYIKRVIKQVIGEKNCKIYFYEYYSGEEFLNNIDSLISYDLLILDMQLGGIDGDEVARIFRIKYPETVLVFCSGFQLPTVKSFKTTPFRYLLKSFSDKEFTMEMKEILEEIRKKSKELFIIGHYRNKIIRVRIKNILYIENAKRGSKIIVTPESEEAKFDGLILVDEKLRELSEIFEDLKFAHNSYIVNINHVEYVNGNELILDNGEILSISRTYQKEFRESFTKNIANKYR